MTPRKTHALTFLKARSLGFAGDSRAAADIFATMSVGELWSGGFKLIEMICSESAADSHVAVDNIHMSARRARKNLKTDPRTFTKEETTVISTVLAAMEDAYEENGRVALMQYRNSKWKQTSVANAFLIAVNGSINYAMLRGIRHTQF